MTTSYHACVFMAISMLKLPNMSSKSPESSPSKARRLVGNLLIWSAHAVTVARTVVANKIAIDTAKGSKPNAVDGAKMAMVGIGDKFDGFLARHGHKLRGTEPGPKSKRFDELSDKEIFHVFMGSLVVDRLRTKKYPEAVILLGIQAVALCRDVVITRHRNNLPDEIDPSPVEISKWKTGVQNLGLALEAGLPEPLNAVIGSAALAASDVMGLIGYHQQLARDNQAISVLLSTPEPAISLLDGSL